MNVKDPQVLMDFFELDEILEILGINDYQVLEGLISRGYILEDDLTFLFDMIPDDEDAEGTT